MATTDFKVGDRVKYSKERLRIGLPEDESRRGVVVDPRTNAHDSRFPDGFVVVLWDDAQESPAWGNPSNFTLADPEILQGVPLDPPVPCERGFSADTEECLEWRDGVFGACGIFCGHEDTTEYSVFLDTEEDSADLERGDEIESAIAGLFALEEGVG